MKFKIDRFILAIFIVIGIAYFFPEGATEENKTILNQISTIGIALIFFFYGLKLSRDKIKNGLKNPKLHFLIQATTFLFFPLLILPFHFLIQTKETHTIWLAFFFLAALPSTVSSSVVMVNMAKGNITGAIFNASISGLIGVLVTPLWMGLFLDNSSADFNLMETYLQLLKEILLPVLIGLLLQRFLGKYAQKYSHYISNFDKSVILLIIYKSFAESFLNNIFSSVEWFDLIWIATAVIVLFFIVFWFTGFLSKSLHFNKEDQITAQYCGSKKSLVHGTVFYKILFPASYPAGLILLPLMLFHAFQIIVISYFAGKENRS